MNDERAEAIGRQSILMKAAVDAVEDLKRQLRWFRWVMGAMVVIIIALGAGYVQVRGVQSAQRAATVAGCQAGNSYRAADAANWDRFLAVALGPHPAAHAVALAAQIRGFVHHADMPRDCSKL